MNLARFSTQNRDWIWTAFSWPALYATLCLAIIPGLALVERVLWVSIGAALTVWLSRRESKQAPCSALEWLGRHRQGYGTRWLALLLGIFALLAMVLGYRPGVTIERTSPGMDRAEIRLPLEAFRITPAHVSGAELDRGEATQTCETLFLTSDTIYNLLFHASHGEARWWVNGEEAAYLAADRADRYLYIPLELEPGVHSLRMEIAGASPPPTVTIEQMSSVSERLQPLTGPFFSHWLPIGGWLDLTALACLSGVGLFLLLFPSLNALTSGLAGFGWRYRRALAPLAAGLMVVLMGARFAWVIGAAAYPLEADEAAFGIMAQRLLAGEWPPAFHYGQAYQGTLEAFALAGLLQLGVSEALAVKFIGLTWGVGFLGLLGYALWRWGSVYCAVGGLAILALSSNHLYWMLSKGWFGYSFGLLCGAALMVMALQAWQSRQLRLGMAIGFGVVSGLMLYELPVAVPLLLLALLMLMGLGWRLWQDDRGAVWGWCKAITLVAIAGVIVLLPGVVSLLYGVSEVSSDGPALVERPPAPVGEQSLLASWDANLPVALGTTEPFAFQDQVLDNAFEQFGSFIFLLALILLSYQYGTRKWHLFDDPLTASAVLLGWATLLIVGFSPYGAWPWYFIALYWCFPIVLVAAGVWLYAHCQALVLGALLFGVVSMSVGVAALDSRWQNPVSLARDGMTLDVPYPALMEAFEKHDLHAVFCDQGFDVAADDAGRDWVGENLFYLSGGEIRTVQRLSRRVPAYAQEAMQSNRAGYLFHRDYFYNNPALENYERYVPLTSDALDALLNGQLGYARFDLGEWRLYVPDQTLTAMQKPAWRLDSNNPIFLGAAHDHQLVVRGYGRDAYWSSDYLPAEGGYLQIMFPEEKTVEQLVLFHGTKSRDHVYENEVIGITKRGEEVALGSMRYEESLRSSVIEWQQPHRLAGIRVVAYPPEDNSWLTVFEIWVK